MTGVAFYMNIYHCDCKQFDGNGFEWKLSFLLIPDE